MMMVVVGQKRRWMVTVRGGDETNCVVDSLGENAVPGSVNSSPGRTSDSPFKKSKIKDNLLLVGVVVVVVVVGIVV